MAGQQFSRASNMRFDVAKSVPATSSSAPTALARIAVNRAAAVDAKRKAKHQHRGAEQDRRQPGPCAGPVVGDDADEPAPDEMPEQAEARIRPEDARVGAI